MCAEGDRQRCVAVQLDEILQLRFICLQGYLEYHIVWLIVSSQALCFPTHKVCLYSSAFVCPLFQRQHYDRWSCIKFQVPVCNKICYPIYAISKLFVTVLYSWRGSKHEGCLGEGIQECSPASRIPLFVFGSKCFWRHILLICLSNLRKHSHPSGGVGWGNDS